MFYRRLGTTYGARNVGKELSLYDCKIPEQVDLNTQDAQQTAIHVTGCILTRNPSQRGAEDARFRQCNHRHRRGY